MQGVTLAYLCLGAQLRGMSALDGPFWRVMLRSRGLWLGTIWGTFLQNYQSWFVIHLSLFSSFCTEGLRALWWELCRCSTVSRLRSRESSLSLDLGSDHSLSLIVFKSVNTLCPHANCTVISGIIWRRNRSICIMSSKKISKCKTQQ